jgi:hypothetical protein
VAPRASRSRRSAWIGAPAAAALSLAACTPDERAPDFDPTGHEWCASAAQRVGARANPHIQIWVPYVDPRSGGFFPPPMPERMIAQPTPRWPFPVLDALDELYYGSHVGRVVMDHVVKRTTIYDAGRGGNYASPDVLEALDGRLLLPAEANAEAATGRGWAATVHVDAAQTGRLDHGLPRELRFSLLHELVHAVTITHGCYRGWSPNQRCYVDTTGAPSPEEAFAWVVENMYRYEVSRIGRSRYVDGRGLAFGALPNSRNTVRALDTIEIYVVAFARAHLPGLAAGLAALDRREVPYNPFRDVSAGARVQRICDLP